MAMPDRRGDELTSFANNIQHMLTAVGSYQDRLREANEHLEEEVATRTHELAETIGRLEEEIGAREEAQALLAAARDEALESAALKSQILANISHDARTPLSVIVLRTEMLKRGQFGPLNARQEQTLDGVLANAYELLGFINNLLQGSKLDAAGQIKPHCTVIEPATWLQEFIQTIQPLAADKDLLLDIEIAPDLADTVEIDADWLKHIVTNLVNNAIKFTDSGSVMIRVGSNGADHWSIEVEDTGSGIPEEALERVFDAFWQVDSSFTRRSNRGIGLGLSIVKQMVELLGGSVSVKSTLGAGSIFTVTLPVVTSQREEAQPQA
jgi:signal transduction histidine kinase